MRRRPTDRASVTIQRACCLQQLYSSAARPDQQAATSDPVSATSPHLRSRPSQTIAPPPRLSPRLPARPQVIGHEAQRRRQDLVSCRGAPSDGAAYIQRRAQRGSHLYPEARPAREPPISRGAPSEGAAYIQRRAQRRSHLNPNICIHRCILRMHHDTQIKVNIAHLKMAFTITTTIPHTTMRVNIH